MRTALTIFTVTVLGVIAGCNGTVDVKKPLPRGKELFTVDFEQGRTLRYRFISSRKTNLDWGSTEGGSKPGKGMVQKFSETMDMVVAYTPVKVDPYGPTTISATCQSVKVNRDMGKSQRPKGLRDAVESLAGETFTFTVNPNGRIEDYSQLDNLIKKIGQKAFRPDSRQGRIKETDMIDDFILTQWFLWDSVSSIETPFEGVSVGQSWGSILSVPTSMVIREARDVTYTLDEIRQSEQGRVAVIRSSYSLAKSVPRTWPIPYTGTFNLAGPFGAYRMIFRGLRVLYLKGQGEERFNIDAGRTKQYNQEYQMQLVPRVSTLPGIDPRIDIEQKLTMQLLEN